jgi:hypothetical protein
MLGGGRLVVGVVKVKVTVFDVPVGFETETPALGGNAVSVARIAAVSWFVLTNVVARAEPFQLTTDPLTKFVPFTVNAKPVGLQYGADDIEVDGATREVIVGAGSGTGLTVKNTTFDTSVVVVAVVPEAPETAEPGIWTATCNVTGVDPVFTMLAAGTVPVT